MNSFDTYLLRRIYKKIAKLGDKLAEADTQIDWTTFRPIIKDLYRNNTERGGRPNADKVVMVKLLVLQRGTASSMSLRRVDLLPEGQVDLWGRHGSKCCAWRGCSTSQLR